MAQRIDLQTFYSGLDALFREHDKSALGAYLEEWLLKARDASDQQGIVAVCNELGGYKRAIGELDAAKLLYTEALERLEAMGKKDSVDAATTLINTGDVYVFSREHEAALDCFLQAKTCLEAHGLHRDYRMAALCNNISMSYSALGRFDEAVYALEQAFSIVKGVADMRAELATTYINLGALQAKQRKLVLAEESYRAACLIFDEDGGVDVHYAQAESGLGEVAFLRGDYAEAKHHFERALLLIERDFGRNVYYRMLAQTLEMIEKKWQEAMQ